MMNYTRKINRGLYLGTLYEFDTYKIIQYETDGLYAAVFHPYQKNRYTSGLGISVNWDTRDYSLYPKSGVFCQSSVVPFSDWIGSDFNFVRYRLDARRYIAFFNDHVLATQFYGQFTSGHAPLNKIAEFGSIYLMRGYYTGRYKDRQMVALQTEYRMPLYWRFGLTAFAGAGEVANTLNNFSFEPLKYSLGYGIRFMLNEETKVNFRLDFAWGRNSFSWFFALGEAF
jgi:outer membrane protein assembly factor BamA